MDYGAAKLRINRLGLSSVPCLKHLITSSLTDSLSMGLEVAFMTPTDAAKDLDHRSMPFQNMEYTRTVRRTVKPALGRSFDSQVAPQGASHTTDRPRGGSKRPLSKDSGEIITVSLKPNCFGEAVPGRSHVS